MIAPDSKVIDVADILLRGIPDEVVAALDERAERLGLSRAELLRRIVTRESAISNVPVTTEDLRRFAELLPDLGDPEVMKGAWE